MDKKSLIGKCLAVGIILLFVGTCIPTMEQDTEGQSLLASSGTWLYVGGSEPGNYTRIQDAIDNASDGDTVYVYAGIYLGNIVINVSIDLMGENKNTTIIDNNSDIEDPQLIEANIYIFADSVTITGFTIQNCYGCGIFLYSSYVLITGNNFYNNSHGIHFYNWNSHVNISNNIFSNNYCGIYLVTCHNDIISENNLINNTFGIRVQSSVNNTIYNNNIVSNIQYGILLFEKSTSNYIYKNNFLNNTKSAYFNLFSLHNTWDGNFWDEPKDTPLLIFGSIGLVFIPWINIDWHPAQEPYDIPG
jgi:parallel beta-helix repeat protein